MNLDAESLVEQPRGLANRLQVVSLTQEAHLLPQSVRVGLLRRSE